MQMKQALRYGSSLALVAGGMTLFFCAVSGCPAASCPRDPAAKTCAPPQRATPKSIAGGLGGLALIGGGAIPLSLAKRKPS